MRFVLDENIPGHTETFLRAADHEIIRPTFGAADVAIARLATQRHAILLTRDHDFLAFLPSKHSGIILIHIHPSIAEHITDVLGTLLAAHPARWLRGKVLILRRDGYELVR